MQKILGLVVMILGIVCLVFGVLFVVQAGSAESEIIDTIEDEGFPVLIVGEAYPYLSINPEETIDTKSEVEDVADALADARQGIEPAPVGPAGFGDLFTPSPLGGGTLKFHEYTGIMAFEGAMNTAQMGLGLASMIQMMGIINILLGLGLLLAGLCLSLKKA